MRHLISLGLIISALHFVEPVSAAPNRNPLRACEAVFSVQKRGLEKNDQKKMTPHSVVGLITSLINYLDPLEHALWGDTKKAYIAETTLIRKSLSNKMKIAGNSAFPKVVQAKFRAAYIETLDSVIQLLRKYADIYDAAEVDPDFAVFKRNFLAKAQNFKQVYPSLKSEMDGREISRTHPDDETVAKVQNWLDRVVHPFPNNLYFNAWRGMIDVRQVEAAAPDPEKLKPQLRYLVEGFHKFEHEKSLSEIFSLVRIFDPLEDETYLRITEPIIRKRYFSDQLVDPSVEIHLADLIRLWLKAYVLTQVSHPQSFVFKSKDLKLVLVCDGFQLVFEFNGSIRFVQLTENELIGMLPKSVGAKAGALPDVFSQPKPRQNLPVVQNLPQALDPVSPNNLEAQENRREQQAQQEQRVAEFTELAGDEITGILETTKAYILDLAAKNSIDKWDTLIDFLNLVKLEQVESDPNTTLITDLKIFLKRLLLVEGESPAEIRERLQAKFVQMRQRGLALMNPTVGVEELPTLSTRPEDLQVDQMYSFEFDRQPMLGQQRIVFAKAAVDFVQNARDNWLAAIKAGFARGRDQNGIKSLQGASKEFEVKHMYSKEGYVRLMMKRLRNAEGELYWHAVYPEQRNN